MSSISRTRKTASTPRSSRGSLREQPGRSAPSEIGRFQLAPRASLLPQEVSVRKRESALRRRAVGGLIAVIVLTLVASGVAWVSVSGKQAELAADQTQSLQLQQELNGFSSVRQLQTQIAEGEAASKVGGSTDIQWGPYFAELQTTLPAGVALSDIKAVSADVTTLFAQAPLNTGEARVATISFTATSSSLPDIPSWINALSTLPGFITAQPGAVTEAAGVYTATVTMDIGAKAFSYRYLPQEQAAK